MSVGGVIFDLDGVLTDTAALHFAAWRELFDDMLDNAAAPFTLDDYRRYVDGRVRTDGVAALLAAPFDDFMAGSRDLTVLFEPTATTSLAGTTWTRHHLVVNVLDDVKNLLHVLTPPAVPVVEPVETSDSTTSRPCASAQRRLRA